VLYAYVKERLLREPDLTLDGAVKLCRAAEASKQHVKDLNIGAGATGGASAGSKTDAEVHAIHRCGSHGSWHGGQREGHFIIIMVYLNKMFIQIVPGSRQSISVPGDRLQRI
jgi:hypothetical protein